MIFFGEKKIIFIHLQGVPTSFRQQSSRKKNQIVKKIVTVCSHSSLIILINFEQLLIFLLKGIHPKPVGTPCSCKKAKLCVLAYLPEFLRHDPRYPNAFTLPSEHDQQNSKKDCPFHFKGQEKTDSS